MEVTGRIIDVVNRRSFPGAVIVRDGLIEAIEERSGTVPDRVILPGFVDSHIHVESTMLTPAEFARLAVRHGTVATVSDPHEIANVCGVEGIDYMIASADTVPLKIFFGAPSCVPATRFETSGAVLDASAVAKLLDRPEILYLAEMMNWPGVLAGEPDVEQKLSSARERGLPVDGHAPGVSGNDARRYAEAGISTDHECGTRQEALDKLEAGMRIAIREGSAARNYDALIDLLSEFPGKIMFCSDDKHPDELLHGYMNEIAARTLGLGYDLFDTLHALCVLPVNHYRLPVGLLQPGDPADFAVVSDLSSMYVEQTWIGGEAVFSDGRVRFDPTPIAPINNFSATGITASDLRIDAAGRGAQFPVIEAYEGELLTGGGWEKVPEVDGSLVADPARDLLKIVVINRYSAHAVPSCGFIKGFGLKRGAIASTVAHDSHNIIAVGASDEALEEAINLVISTRGGLAVVDGRGTGRVLPLPIAGLMSDQPGNEVAAEYHQLGELVKALGNVPQSPFMLLSFMALLVIPRYKIGDCGVFDGETFEVLTRS